MTTASGSPSRTARADAAVPAPSPSAEGAEHGSGSGDALASSREKKSAWSKPANGLVEAGAIMGAVSWPALSEASKVSPKAQSYDSTKGLSNGSIPAPALEPVTMTIYSPPKSAPVDSNSSSSVNHAAPLNHNSMARGAGSCVAGTNATNTVGALANGGPSQPKTRTTPAVSQGSSDKSMNSESSVRELSSKNSGKSVQETRADGSFLQSHSGNDHQKNYGGYRRGSHPGGVRGQHHNNFGNRSGQERGSYDWKHRPFGSGRDSPVQQHSHQQPRAATRPFIRPPTPGSAPFVAPPPPLGRPFANPLGYHDIPPSPFFYVPPPPGDSLRGMSFVAPHSMLFATPADLQLRATLLKQIDYYFSTENLCKDVYLRQNMDEEGWVSILLIAGFNRVRNLTNNVQFILDVVSSSTVVEVQGDKVRRRNDWKNWPPLTTPSNSPHSSSKPTPDILAARLTNIRMEEGRTHRPELEDYGSHIGGTD